MRIPFPLTWVDAADVLAVSALVYAVLLGLRRRRVPHALAGLILFLLLVMGARVAGMRLVSFLFGGLLTAVLLALVILFQDELRRFFDWITAIGIERPKPGQRLEQNVQTMRELCTTAFQLARKRVGALIVVQGKLPVGRHLAGGVPLNGLVSDALLKSLFDPHTPGHDGAVVLDDTRVAYFGTHLPLSTRIEKLEGRGTRHAAALGLSERTDALCVIVSEERGRVSVARRGELEEVQDPAHLLRLLRAQHRVRHGLSERRNPLHVLVRNVPLKAAALGISSVLWYFFVHESVIEYHRFTVPMQPIGLAPNLRLEKASAREADLVVSGPRRAFYFLDAKNFAVRLPLFGADLRTTTVTLTASEARLPDGVEFVNILPREITVEIVSPGESAQ